MSMETCETNELKYADQHVTVPRPWTGVGYVASDTRITFNIEWKMNEIEDFVGISVNTGIEITC